MRAAQQVVREADRRYPVRIRVAVPDGGFGQRLDQIHAWLDQNAGAEGWAWTRFRGVLNDAVSIYFADATMASAFVARWCLVQKAEVTDGLFRVREDEPTPRIPAAHNKTP